MLKKKENQENFHDKDVYGLKVPPHSLLMNFKGKESKCTVGTRQFFAQVVKTNISKQSASG